MASRRSAIALSPRSRPTLARFRRPISRRGRASGSPSSRRSRIRAPPCAVPTSSESPFSLPDRCISSRISRSARRDETALPHAREDHRPHLRAPRARRDRRSGVRRRVYPRQATSLRTKPMLIAESFFDSNTFALARNLTGFFVLVFWLATAFWVFKDARRRIDDPWIVGMAGVLGRLPPLPRAVAFLFPPP